MVNTLGITKIQIIMNREELHQLITDASGFELPRTTLAVESKVIAPLQAEIDRLKSENAELRETVENTLKLFKQFNDERAYEYLVHRMGKTNNK